MVHHTRISLEAPTPRDALGRLYIMEPSQSRFVHQPISRTELATIAADRFGDMVKAVVDVERLVMAIGAELHADDEAALLQDGSRQEDLWGINLYHGESGDGFIEFDAMINIRPARRIRSSSVEDPELRARISRIVTSLVSDE